MINPFQQIIIGIIGGGQLGKMMAQSAKRQGYGVIILDPQKNCPAAQVCDKQIVASYNDAQALKKLNDCCSVITYEFENVDCQMISQMIDKTKFPQDINILEITQDRLREKSFLSDCQINIAPFVPVSTIEALELAIAQIGFPCVLKTTRFGYDGKGQVVLKSFSDILSAKQLVEQGDCVLEGWINFEKEVSIMISRNAKGESSIFPISENKHINNILHTSIVPANVSDGLRQTIIHIAEKIAEQLQLVGTLGIEFFVDKNEKVYVNELAPRPHNSGHYTIEACNFSQFDTSIQSVLNLPMPNIKLLSPVVMVNVLGQYLTAIETLKKEKANWHFHDYGKLESKTNRKMGHITILTTDTATTLHELADVGMSY